MPLFVKILIIVIIVAVAAIIALVILGKRAEKKRDEQQSQIDAAAQTVTMLIIDKKKMRLKDAGLPQAVLDQTPKRMRRMKMPIVKAKVGPKITSLICDSEIYDMVPVKKEVKATISGLYLTGVKGTHGVLEKPEGKKGFMAKLRAKANQ